MPYDEVIVEINPVNASVCIPGLPLPCSMALMCTKPEGLKEIRFEALGGPFIDTFESVFSVEMLMVAINETPAGIIELTDKSTGVIYQLKRREALRILELTAE